MTQSNHAQAAAITTPPTEAPLFLYRVTLAWNNNNNEEGDYCDKAWARSPSHAIVLIARDMADHSDSGCTTDAERDLFVANVIASAGTYAAERVGANLLSDCRELMAGSENDMSAEAAADFATVSALLKKYGAL